MKKKTCCFTGHRAIPALEIEKLRANVEKKIAALIVMGVTNFICGGAIGFDTLAAESVIMFRKTNPMVRLIIAVPCRGQHERWNTYQQKKYEGILKQADEVKYLSDSYYDGCMQKRNEYMVDKSEYCIAYFRNHAGGTLKTIMYAKEKGMSVIYV